MNQATFIVDLARCTGCQACQIACKDRAGLPDNLEWLRVDATEGGKYPHPTLTYRVTHCFHCDQPPCAAACPVEAISREESGLVTIDASECTGCEACVDACPFGATVMLPEGVAGRCDGCWDEVARGWEPTCVRACPMRALAYSADSRSAVVNALRAAGREIDQTFDGRGVGPSVVYLE